MCIAAIAWNAHPRWRLIVAANRDEYHARPAAPLARWDDGSGIIAGRDLTGGGTWLGVHESGRLVLITNFRVPGYPLPGRPSRGGLVTGLLTGGEPQAEDLSPYNPCNLLVASSDGRLTFLGNHPQVQRQPLDDGIHGLSNGGFTPPWPKTARLNQALSDWLTQAEALPSALFVPLRDESPHDSPGDGPGDGPLPHLSGVFIRDPVYGTRCSTVITVDDCGRGTMTERRFDALGETTGETRLAFHWPVGAAQNRA